MEHTAGLSAVVQKKPRNPLVAYTPINPNFLRAAKIFLLTSARMASKMGAEMQVREKIKDVSATRGREEGGGGKGRAMGRG
jgi:hypothetical protein